MQHVLYLPFHPHQLILPIIFLLSLDRILLEHLIYMIDLCLIMIPIGRK